MSWYVYIAECADGSLYTGVTTDPKRRLKQHNAGRGSAYVRSKGSASLVYTELWPNESAARRREIEVKSWSRQKKLALIDRCSYSFR
ncbi:MAG: GIY-YIG nuclease family protein [Candidatus Omnitrophica bacterium]|nr:GIY-YIG nuclease family protein [Candidatus Omnitrophota bacterium]